jgi:hypothetical protein
VKLEVVVNTQKFFQSEFFQTHSESLQLRPLPDCARQAVDGWLLALFPDEEDAVQLALALTAEMRGIALPSLVLFDFEAFGLHNFYRQDDLFQAL